MSSDLKLQPQGIYPSLMILRRFKFKSTFIFSSILLIEYSKKAPKTILYNAIYVSSVFNLLSFIFLLKEM